MIKINPCDCGGIPYDTHKDDKYGRLYYMKCMACGTVSSLEYSIEEAIIDWNKKHNSFKIDDNYLNQKLLAYELRKNVRKNNPKLFGHIEQWQDHTL